MEYNNSIQSERREYFTKDAVTNLNTYFFINVLSSMEQNYMFNGDKLSHVSLLIILLFVNERRLFCKVISIEFICLNVLYKFKKQLLSPSK